MCSTFIESRKIMNKKMLRKVLVITLAIVMMLVFAACNSNANKSSNTEVLDLSGSSSKSSSSSTEKDDPIPPEDPPVTKLPDTVTPEKSDLEEQLIGYWVEIDIDNTYYFFSDGTGYETFDTYSWDMTWSLDGDILTMDFPDTGVEIYPITINGDRLNVYDDSAGIMYEYDRQ